MGVGGQRHDPAALPPRKSLGTHCTVGWVVPGPVWMGVEERKSLAVIRVRTPNRLACCVVDILPHKSLVLVFIPSGAATLYGARGQ
jgi:hypothetical protein